MTESLYPEDVDRVWFGTDNFGNIAAFCTAGKGPVPESFLKEFPDYDLIENWLGSLPEFEADNDLYPVGFENLARKGFFVYDWSDVHRVNAESLHGYELLAAPARPLNLAQLSAPKQLLSRIPTFDKLTFGLAPIMFVDEFHECLWPRYRC